MTKVSITNIVATASVNVKETYLKFCEEKKLLLDGF